MAPIVVDKTKASSLFIDRAGNVWQGKNNGKIFMSPDDGISWLEKFDFEALGLGNHDIRPLWGDSIGNLYASRNLLGALYRSTDGGSTWAPSLIFSNPAICSGFQIAEDKQGNIYVGEYSQGDGREHNAYVYKSTDHGDTWTTILYDSEARHTHAIVYDPYGDALYVTTGENIPCKLFKTTDGGENWTILSQGTEVAKATTIIPGNGYRIFGSDNNTGHIYRTINDKDFTLVFEPPETHEKNNYYWGAQRRCDGFIIMGAQVEGITGYNAILVGSWNHGAKWGILQEEGDWDGATSWGYLTGCISQGKGYIFYASKADNNIVRADFPFPGVKLEDWLPMSPDMGPPLPRYLGIYWPWYAPPGAEFRVSAPVISPEEVNPGQVVTITCLVTNIGSEAGGYTVKIGGDFMAQQSVTLQPGESKAVSFEVTPTVAKTYSVSVDGQTGSFRAVEVPVADIKVENLVITPSEVYVGDKVTISVTARNYGSAAGSKTIVCQVV